MEEAVRKLTEAGLAEPMIRREYDEAEKGRVTGQNTEAGSLLARGSVITLIVSRGPEPFELPDLVGWEAAAAKALLDSRGITVSFEYVIRKDVAEDLILEQDLVPKTILYKGDCIRLTVSEKEPLRNVADVTGLSRNEAEEKLRAQGFTVLVREDYDSRIPSGCVISQDPAAGTPQDAGVRISLLVSKGPRPTQPLPTNPPVTQPVPTRPAQTDPVPTQPEPTQPAPTETVPESTEKAYITYRFRSSRLLNEHYQKHGIEMGFSSASAYEKAASDVINNPDALCKREKEDNDFV
ncbi:MAG: PASTA domain-containing protein, partial [Lachnospiraceae bacterium]|nr:PASTA domain-containing protein [Lachnospiraceae bacterium]